LTTVDRDKNSHRASAGLRAHAAPPAARLSQAKRRAMVDAATKLFLERGYEATSMEHIAAAAGVAKQTVYKHFVDKPTLFAAIVKGVVQYSDAILEQMAVIIDDPGDDLEHTLSALASYYGRAVLEPRVIRLRRLVLAEADRFPHLAHLYYERGPTRAFNLLAEAFTAFHDTGLLSVDDPPLAARQFAGLVLYAPQDRALFHPRARPRPSELKWFAAGAVRTFLAAYGRVQG
jgi:TetR/AcrR family transcriptional repressor of mexJK operon